MHLLPVEPFGNGLKLSVGVRGDTVASCVATQFNSTLPQPVGSKEQTCLPPTEAFTCPICFSFNVKMLSNLDKIAATEAFMLISLAAPTLTHSRFFFLSVFSVVVL